ncbi:single-stranded DNA-binding protein [Orenia metallireducens]|jgi:single-strand DNA-binding protein|uniref:Single-stranded DNA-binding protein n=1 Tax=Orenia metallireducens TaxID=1413210 RepID=A0A1C0A905_9FIRM|nr:single-stranded DNA-binding protein [Orenia metallireducens]OCL26711.1 single-stranded DNA-binding protein [Orenia metallireducens]
MVNQVNLVGRLACNPELKTFSSGTKKATLVVAVDREYKSRGGEQKTDFIYVEVWRKLAEQCADNLEKGRLVAIEGRIQIDSWKDQDSGEMRYKTGIVAKNVKFLGKSKSEKQATA